jgi:hypothetical protein
MNGHRRSGKSVRVSSIAEAEVIGTYALPDCEVRSAVLSSSAARRAAAETVVARAANAGRANMIHHVNYPDAGHTLLSYTPTYTARPGLDAPPRFDFGGTPEANAASAADAWSRVVRGCLMRIVKAGR